MKNPKHWEFGYKDGDKKKNFMHFQSLSSYHEAKISKQVGISLWSTVYNGLTFCLKIEFPGYVILSLISIQILSYWL